MNLKVKAKVGIGYDYKKNEYVEGMKEVEVLTIHFEKNTMRVRYKADFWGDGVRTHVDNIPADPFFEQYQINKKEA